MEKPMGRPPSGKVAMTGAERTRLYRHRHATAKPVTKPVTKPADPDHTALMTELARAKARIAELEAGQGQPKADADHAVLQAHIAELTRELEGSRKEVANAHRLIAAANDFLDRKARIIPHEMYQTLIQSTHPDHVTDPKAKARYEKAFVFLKENEPALAKRKPPPKPPPMPSTWAELDAAKWHVREERKAKRAATRAAKAPRKSLGKAR
jgi:hypothetical protein